MAIDLTGGIDPAREYMFAERPDNPEMRDSVSFWVFDDRGQVGLPRIGIEAVAANWDAHGVQVNVAFPDGRVYRLREDAAGWPVEGPDGKPTTLGAGPLAFTCVEPFNVWTMTFDGQVVQTSSADLVEGRKDGPLVDLQFEVEAKLAVPPWVRRWCPPTTSLTPARFPLTSWPSSRIGRSPRCSRRGCAIDGMARRPTGCSSARARWTKSAASSRSRG